MLRAAVVAAVISHLVGCATYKIEATSEYQSTSVETSSELYVTQVNDYAEGVHCFEPMLHVLSLQLIPTHCIERYNVSDSHPSKRDETTLETHFVVTSMQGWIALPMSLSRQWRFGYGEDAAVQIEQLVRQEAD